MYTYITYIDTLIQHIRNAQNGYYQLRSFYMAYIVTSFTFQTLYTCVYGAVVFFLTAMYSGGANFGIFITVQLLLSYLGTMMGLIAGALGECWHFDCQICNTVLYTYFARFSTCPEYSTPPPIH